jgi:hypothetical protein
VRIILLTTAAIRTYFLNRTYPNSFIAGTSHTAREATGGWEQGCSWGITGKGGGNAIARKVLLRFIPGASCALCLLGSALGSSICMDLVSLEVSR